MDSRKEVNRKIDGEERDEGYVVCPMSECVHARQCEIIRITGKIPSLNRKCSYFEKPRQSKRKSSDEGTSEEL